MSSSYAGQTPNGPPPHTPCRFENIRSRIALFHLCCQQKEAFTAAYMKRNQWKAESRVSCYIKPWEALCTRLLPYEDDHFLSNAADPGGPTPIVSRQQWGQC
ncbi:hypothetical protein D4764_0108910 [Takifugu flavidus]|uniref:Uncharacterized protein n=1 Tax=Takifugu flavidus TaxID=433684 RepID=A0A5C6MJ17_9TELE|nr:hypothetical protein D4764_0108910 [Takifugu flavidus]